MGADGADFGESGWGESLTGHCGEAAVDADSDKSAEGGGLVAEWAGFGEGREGFHFGEVGRCERNDRLCEVRLVWKLGADHLDEGAVAD